MKHKHAELIKAWADGAKIEKRGHTGDGKWYEDSRPQWYESLEYRIKTEENLEHTK